MSQTETMPRILLVEDDAISLAFFRAVLESLPAAVDTAGSVASALDRAGRRTHDLWLIDANLPDGTGEMLLSRLRAHSPDTPALAHTADATAQGRLSLLEAGFDEALLKPIGSHALLAAVRRALERGIGRHPRPFAHAPPPVAETDWDDAAALDAMNGQHDQVNALRQLFLEELPGARDSVLAAARERDLRSLRATLHRLSASCSFVGAARLAAAVRQLQADPESPAALERFRSAAQALLR